MFPDATVLGDNVCIDTADVDAIFAETVWRTGSGMRIAVVPPISTETALLADSPQEIKVARDALDEFFCRNDLVLAPLVAGGHWVLLCFESSAPSVALEDRPALKPEEHGDVGPVDEFLALIGCAKCGWSDSGCAACERSKLHRRERRFDVLNKALFPLTHMSPLTRGDGHSWHVRYYPAFTINL